jgi:hypothetical protein
VGACLGSPRASAASGNLEQRTAGGLLVWNGADNVAAFTDGVTTWYLCRGGLVERPSSDAFRCEQDVAPRLVDHFDGAEAPLLPAGSSDPAHYFSGYVGGEYQIKTVDPAWELAPAEYLERRFTDASLSVVARIVGPTDDRYVALVCRHQDPRDSGYRLTASPAEGWVLLTRWDDGQPTHLIRQQPSAVIRRGGESNRFELGCVGDTISASVNGTPVALVQDGTYKEGKLGLSASSFTGSGKTIDARFDDLIVTGQ